MAQDSHQPIRSLSEVHRSVQIPGTAGVFRRILAFAGPAYLVSVGYMDPGNWATDLEGGARFGYQLIWVLVMSNAMAVLLQTLAARLGIVTGRDLAQACRENYPRPVALVLWLLCEVAIVACDLAEALGTAIGLNLLFHLPMLIGVIITGFDTMLFLVIQHYGVRKMEGLILSLVAIIGVCFGLEMVFSRPGLGDIAGGFVPRLTAENLYIAIGILGATVMPHNLYLHSALVQTRVVPETEEGKRQACRFNLVDTGIALNAALFVNGAILVLSATTFFKRGIVVTEIQQAHELLTPLLGTAVAGTLFAVALIAAGQSSTLTGTLAGQIVMEGFLQFKIRPAVRRLITRLLAIVPAVVVIAIQGERGSYDLLILSQVILSVQLPFAVIPLIQLTSSREAMGPFANKRWVQVLAWASAAIIVGLDVRLFVSAIADRLSAGGTGAEILWVTVVPASVAWLLILLYIGLPPSWRRLRKVVPAATSVFDLAPPTYSRIGVALDYSDVDGKVLAHALTLAKHHAAEIFLFHIVEGVSGQLYGKEAFDGEARSDPAQLSGIAEQLRKAGAQVRTVLGFGRVPTELVRLARDSKVDLIVMGAHGHRGLMDIFFGTSISEVRHQLTVPVLVVQ